MPLAGILRNELHLKRLLFWFFFLTIYTSANAQDNPLNTLDLYQRDGSITCNFSLQDLSDSLYVYVSLDFQTPLIDTLWGYISWNSLEKTFQDSLLLQPANDGFYGFKFSFTDQTLPPLITLNITYKGRARIYQQHFPLSAYHPSGGLNLSTPLGPLTENWKHSGDSLLITTPRRQNVFVYYYSHKFEPARPPMTLRSRESSRTLSIDTIFVLSTGEYHTLNRPGLYFFQADSSTTTGTSVFIAEPPFPNPQKIADLSEPLIYITTKGEYQRLERDLTSKQSFDKFWLSTLKSPDKARQAIKSYYDNVEMSNALFTSYKEGWKTDRGLIYTVMGSPLLVTKDHLYEQWMYLDAAGEEVIFEFRKIKNIFSNNHYELIRDKAYDRLWFQAVDRWRKGQIQ